MPIFREIMLGVYQDDLLGRAPRFPREIENGISQYLAMLETLSEPPPETMIGASAQAAATEGPALTSPAAGLPSGANGPEEGAESPVEQASAIGGESWPVGLAPTAPTFSALLRELPQ